MTPRMLGLVIAAVGFVLDQASKQYFLQVADLGETGPVQWAPFAEFRLVWNYGISYGLLEAKTDLGRWMLVLTAIGVTSFLVWWLSSVKDLRLTAAIGLIIGGAVGNVIDRMVYGAVADFFLLHAFGYNWYVFNIADIAVVGGVILMALDLVLNETKGKLRDAKEDRS